jgi:hypothetical protein
VALVEACWLGWHLPVDYPSLSYNCPSEGIRG